jgi:hypothetical protein
MLAYVVIIPQYVILCYSVVNSNSLASGPSWFSAARDRPHIAP